MSQFATDFCSTVSSTFSDCDEHVLEPPEMKFVPVQVKNEIEELSEDESCVKDDDLDDHFLKNTYDCDHDGTSIIKLSKETSRRACKNRRVNLAESDDDDYNPSTDKEWGRGPSYKAKKRKSGRGAKSKAKRKSEASKDVHNHNTEKFEPMTHERRGAKTRKNKTQYCKGEKLRIEMRASSGGQDGDGDGSRVKFEVKTGIDKYSSNVDAKEQNNNRVVKIGSPKGGYRKKRISEMTEEEKETIRARWRLERQRKKARKKGLPPPAKLDNFVSKPKVNMTTTRKVRTLKDALTEEERHKVKEQYQKDIERKRVKRALMTPQEKHERNQKEQIRRLNRKAKGKPLTEDELRVRRMNDYLRRQARLAMMTPEEKDARKKCISEKNREKWQRKKLITGEMERIRERNRLYRENMSTEKRERFLQKLRESAKRQMERWKEDPERLNSLKEQWRRNAEATRQRRKIKLVGVEESGVRKKCCERKSNLSAPRKQRETKRLVLTEEEKQKRLELRRMFDRKRKLKRKLMIQNLLDGGMTMEQIMQQTETLDQRKQRLILQRIAKARADLRKRLQSHGAPAEEIIQKISELEASYEPKRDFRPYRHRPNTWLRVDPKELENLEEKLKSVATPHTIPRSRSNARITESQQPPSQRKQSRSSEKEEINENSQVVTVTPTNPQPLIYMQPSTTGISSNGECFQNSYRESSAYSHPAQPHHQQFQFQSQPFYPHQLPQSLPPPSHSYTLQNILHIIKYQDSEGVTSNLTCLPNQVQVINNEHEHVSSSATSQHEYEDSSTYDDGYNNDFSQPNPNPNQNRQSTENSPIRKRCVRKSFTKPLRPGAKGRTKRLDVIRDVICDLCGKAFNNLYIREHQRIFHNPNFDAKTRTCLVCSEKFRISKKWYQHFIRVHVNSEKTSTDKSVICSECGKALKSMDNYKKHMYFVHGDGLKKENLKRCPVCPMEKFFKENAALQGHMKRAHPNHKWCSGLHKCYRCNEDCRNEPELREHVKVVHPEHYFPCQWCGAVRFTQLSLNFHYSTRKCAKMPKGWREGIVKTTDYISLERAEMHCEFCHKMIAVKGLTDHYKAVHNVQEDKRFKCMDCDKVYKRREFVVVHMEEAHLKTLEEMTDYVRKLQSENKEGLRLQAKKPIRTRGRGKAIKRAVVCSKNDDVEDDNCATGNSEEEGEVEKDGGKNRRRNIVVICEEDGDDLVDWKTHL